MLAAHNCAGIVLAGGRSSRMGRDKALLPLPGAQPITFVEHLISLLTPLCREVIVVARDAVHAAAFADVNGRVITDKVAAMGPLMGLYSGLSAVGATIGTAARITDVSHALVTAVDMPFLQPALLEFLLSQPMDEAMLVPVVNQLPQVLLAIYPCALLPVIEKRLNEGRRDPRSLLEVAAVRYIEEAQLRAFDPQLRSFINLNTPEELAAYT